MPFLKTLNLFAKNVNVPDIPPVIPDIETPPDEPERYEPTLSINGKSNKARVLVSTKNMTNKQKGNMYEDYIGKLYKAKGYAVIPWGRLMGRWDGGRDLICRHGRYTVIVQCKYHEYGYGAKIDVTDVYKLYGAIKHYAIRHKPEIVSGAFWTTVTGNDCNYAHKAAEELRIAFYEGVYIYKQQ